MRKRFAGVRAAWLVVSLTALSLAACSPKNTATNDLIYVPTVRQISTRLVNATVGRLQIPAPEAAEVWLLPTPTPVASSLFDKVFGKARPSEAPQEPDAAQATQGTWGTVTVQSLNVRNGPGTEYPVLTALAAGERLQIAEQASGWVRFMLPDGQTGWSLEDYVNIEAVEVAAAHSAARPASGGVKAIVLAEMLNVRERPELTSNVIAALGRQECVEILGQENGWVQVGLTAEKTGWCRGDFVQEVAVCPTPAPPDPYAVGGAVSVPVGSESAPVSAVATPTRAALSPLAPNATVVTSTNLHECFGGGWDELRYVRAGTPVQVLGAGPFVPPGSQANDMGPGPYVKIRLWDGQYAWIAAQAVGVDAASAAQISGQCEAGDRIDWSLITPPTPTPMPAPTQGPAATPQPASQLRPTATPRATPTAAHEHEKRDE